MQTVDYKAIARRFRPKLFKEVTGQESVVTTLKNAVIYKKASHAYLFCGIRGTGKTSLARLFAKALNCKAPSAEGEPCNECAACLDIMSGKSLDVIEIDGASNRGIDDIRALNESLGYKAFQGKYKIFIIDEVHMLTKEAFNALLKSLEEPPADVKFFLATTEPQKVLPTIVSRCQRFDLARIAPGAIMKKLRSIAKEMDVHIEDEALALIAKLSEGSLRDAESLFDQLICLGQSPITAPMIAESLGLIERKEYFEFDDAFQSGDLSFAFTFVQKLFSTGKDTTYFLETLLEHYRNIALLQLGKLDLSDVWFTEDEKLGYQKALTIYDRSQVLRIINYLSELVHQASRPSYKKVHMEIIMMHLLQEKQRVSIDQVVRKLESLKGMTRKEPELIPVPIPAPLPIPVVEPENKVETTVSPSILAPPSMRHETILRFAQVELAGSLKKNF